MGWFENQIRERREADDRLLEDSFVRIAGVVEGKRFAEKIGDERIITKNAIDEILKYYHFKTVEIPDTVKTVEEQIDFCLRSHGLKKREIELTEGWQKDSFGPILAFTKEEGRPVALLPGRLTGYIYQDMATGEQIRVTQKEAALFQREAFCFYCPLPQKKLTMADLIVFMKRCISVSDIAFFLSATLIVTLVGMLMPGLTKALTGPVLLSGKMSALMGIAVCMFCVLISAQLFNSVNGILEQRIVGKTSLLVEASMMMRLMSLPASFFRGYSPGELKSRFSSVSSLCSLLLNMVLTTGLTSIASLLYITQIFHYAKALVVPSFFIIVVTVGFSVLSTFVQVRVNKARMEIAAKESGMTYGLITGIQKVKLAGAEKRMFARWLNLYAGEAELLYNPPMFIKLNGVIMTAIGLASNIILYYLAIQSQISQSDYFAFSAAYGAVMGAFSSIAGLALSAAQIKPILEMAEPILQAEPETADGKEIVTNISGGLEIEHIAFRYSEDTPYIFEDLSLKIRPGEYVALVGKTGCGKSTIIRLLLGFEKPEKGAIYYDGKDISGLDLGSLRKKIGTVMQDAGLFQGDIYSNIVITAPELSLNDAWEAAEKAGIAEDISAMPMGMHTIISEGAGGISGGQKQRIMIARAIAPKPKLLIFDEATSALDNKTQRQVSESLDAMGCTRIVVAHRLSTIKHCDRILVIDGGRIIEDGTYDTLIKQGGFFAELVERQRLDTEGNA